jgi:hypothetical protein
MSGDTPSPGERLWYVRETNGEKGYNSRQYGHERAFYAKSRKDAKEQFIAAGYKQFESSQLAASAESETQS